MIGASVYIVQVRLRARAVFDSGFSSTHAVKDRAWVKPRQIKRSDVARKEELLGAIGIGAQGAWMGE